MNIYKKATETNNTPCTQARFAVAEEGCEPQGKNWVLAQDDDEELEFEIAMGGFKKLYRQAGVEYFGTL